MAIANVQPGGGSINDREKLAPLAILLGTCRADLDQIEQNVKKIAGLSKLGLRKPAQALINALRTVPDGIASADVYMGQLTARQAGLWAQLEAKRAAVAERELLVRGGGPALNGMEKDLVRASVLRGVDAGITTDVLGKIEKRYGEEATKRAMACQEAAQSLDTAIKQARANAKKPASFRTNNALDFMRRVDLAREIEARGMAWAKDRYLELCQFGTQDEQSTFESACFPLAREILSMPAPKLAAKFVSAGGLTVQDGAASQARITAGWLIAAFQEQQDRREPPEITATQVEFESLMRVYRLLLGVTPYLLNPSELERRFYSGNVMGRLQESAYELSKDWLTRWSAPANAQRLVDLTAGMRGRVRGPLPGVR